MCCVYICLSRMECSEMAHIQTHTHAHAHIKRDKKAEPESRMRALYAYILSIVVILTKYSKLMYVYAYTLHNTTSNQGVPSAYKEYNNIKKRDTDTERWRENETDKKGVNFFLNAMMMMMMMMACAGYVNITAHCSAH